MKIAHNIGPGKVLLELVFLSKKTHGQFCWGLT